MTKTKEKLRLKEERKIKKQEEARLKKEYEESLKRVREENLKKEKSRIAKEYYEVYRKFGFEKFKETFNYPYSKPNLVNFLARNCKEFVPQSRIKRGTK